MSASTTALVATRGTIVLSTGLKVPVVNATFSSTNYWELAYVLDGAAFGTSAWGVGWGGFSGAIDVPNVYTSGNPTSIFSQPKTFDMNGNVLTYKSVSLSLSTFTDVVSRTLIGTSTAVLQ